MRSALPSKSTKCNSCRLPTFINSAGERGAPASRLSSLEMVTYGTEVMPGEHLKGFHELFPKIACCRHTACPRWGSCARARVQPIRCGSRSAVTASAPGWSTGCSRSSTVRNARLLNAASPFTPTAGSRPAMPSSRRRVLPDIGEEIGAHQCRGREVYPVEVESVLQAMEGGERRVKGESHPITVRCVRQGQAAERTKRSEFRKRMFAHCREKLPRFRSAKVSSCQRTFMEPVSRRCDSEWRGVEARCLLHLQTA